VEPGQVAGVRKIGSGRRAGELVVELDLRMYVGADSPRDEVEIEGEPPLHMVLQGGVAGDVATAAILVNTLPRAAEASAKPRSPTRAAFCHEPRPVA
jgi:4-hydroxy-tetrahydrodipicolinate reductase